MSTNRPLSRDDFAFAIICALPLERDAVEALLDEDYEEDGFSYGKAVGDKNAYTIGRLGKQHVVVAYMPGMGTISAAAVAANLNSSFPNIQVALVVGVCGGIPVRASAEDDDEIHLGDVIVSTSVVQIDCGRQYPDGFQRKKEVEDVLGRADPEIRAFVGRLSGYRSRMRLKDKIYSLSSQISSMKGFPSSVYPGPQCDKLYAADHRHKHWSPGCEICDRCKNDADEVCEIATDSDCESLGCQGVSAGDGTEARPPAVHFGRIACGNQVMKSGIHRDRLAAQEKVIGFEMESAGTWDYIPTIVVKSVCDYADSHKSKQWQRHAAANAAACAKAILDEWRSVDRRAQGLPSRPKFPVHTTVTRPINTMFTGRHDILDDVKTIIRNALEDSRRQEPCHIIISGMGGQGKSEICLQLCHQLRDLFWGVFWIDVSSTSQAENGFLDIAERLGRAASTWEAARNELTNMKQPWLLVLDNADDPDVDYQPYFPTSAFGVVLLTSRNAECEQHATKKWIDLEGLAQDDARELLFKACRISSTCRISLKADAQGVVQLLQSHPLALIQAGSYITRGHCSLKEYPRVYERQRKRLLEFRPAQARSRYRDVYATFEASAETLRLSETEAASDALELLSLLAMYGPNRLPVILFEATWKAAQYVPTCDLASNELYQNSPWQLAHLPTFIQIRNETWDPFRLMEALNLLKAFSLVSVDGEASSLSVSMHPLVHAWARDRLNAEQQHTYWIRAGCVMAFQDSGIDEWFRNARQIQPHLQALILWPINTMFGPDLKVEICRILIGCGWLLDNIRDDSTLLTLWKSLCTYLNLDKSIVTLQWLDLHKLIARNLYHSALLRDSIMLLKQVVGIEEKTLAEDHPHRLSSQHALALAYIDNGQARDAIMLLEHVVGIEEKTLAEDHPSRLSSQHELALAYIDNGQVRDALRLLEQVVKIRETTLAEDHPHRLASQHSLATAYRYNGQVRDAIMLLEQVVSTEEKTLAEDHPHRLSSQHELASAYRYNGQARDAIILLEHVVRIREKTLAEDHPDRLASQHALAMAYRANGQVRDAIMLLEQVVSIEEKTLAEDHPHRLASQRELALSYRDNGQVRDAIMLLEQVVSTEEKTLAEDHPSRLNSQYVLATCLWQVDERIRAVDIMRHVVRTRRQSLNEDHPHRTGSQEWLHYFETEMKKQPA